MRQPKHEDASPPGGLFQDRRHLRADLRMVRQAVSRGWPIPPETWSCVVQSLGEIFSDDSEGSFTRAQVTAVDLILTVKKSQTEKALRIFRDRAGSNERP